MQTYRQETGGWIDRQTLIGNGLTWSRRLRRAGSATHELETLGRRWLSFSLSPGPKAAEDQCVPAPRQLESQNSFSLDLFVLFRPPTDWMKPVRTGEGDLFTQSPDSNVHLVHRHSWTHLGSCMTNVWAPHGLAQWTHTSDHHYG